MFLVPYLRGGGAERATVTIANLLDPEEFESTILIQRSDVVLYKPRSDVQVIVVGKTRAKSILPALVQHLRKRQPDVLYSALHHLNVLAIVAGQMVRPKPRIIVSVHNNSSEELSRVRFGRVLRSVVPVAYQYADAVVGVSRGVVEELARMGIREMKLHAMPNPIEVRAIQTLQQSPVAHPWLHSGAPVIVSMGRLTEQKGFPYLIEAFSQVRKVYPDAKLIILGEGELLHALRKMASDLGLLNAVDFLGFVKNPYPYITRATVFVLASLWEGFGMAIVEAMACKVPVVATRCAYGPEEIINDGVNGVLVPPRDSSALADAMLRLLGNDEMRVKLAERAALRALDYEATKVVPSYASLFRRVVAGGLGS